MTSKTLKAFSIAAALGVSAGLLQGNPNDVQVLFTFDDGLNFTDEAIIPSAFPSGLTSASNWDVATGTPLAAGISPAGNAALSTSVGGEIAFEFSIEIPTGFYYEPNEVSFISARPFDGVTDWGLYFDGVLAASGSTGSANMWALATADISSAGQLVGNVTVTLKATGAMQQSSWSVDNFTLSGAVIPEPGTYALIFGGLALGLVFFRRLRR
ncbi:MAG: PEP-CTERM sorting domain-containing protein [Puniceicoccaceae bacterium]|nr:MAG: PEP-CTERM sorting domain-containing protein [Puniceicoccaceae bacterium]